MRAAIFQADSAGQSVNQRLVNLDSVLNEQSLDLLVCTELYLLGYNVDDNLRKYAKLEKGEYTQVIADIAIKH